MLKWLQNFAAIKPSLLAACCLSQSSRGLEEHAHGKKRTRGDILSSGQRLGSPVVASVAKKAGERKSCFSPESKKSLSKRDNCSLSLNTEAWDPLENSH